MHKIETKLSVRIAKIMALFEYLISIENFSAYTKILHLYRICLINIIDKENDEISEEDLSSLLNVSRLFFEAPPSNKILMKFIIDKMQESYELERKIIEQNSKK